MYPLLNIAIRAARSAGPTIVRAQQRLDIVRTTEKAPNDYVSNVDQQAEQIIIETIRKSYPSHTIVAEESGVLQGDDTTWVIDPLDGTYNFLQGIPLFSISIAVKRRGIIEHGVVYDPIRDEMFSASRGAGAQLNEHRIRVSSKLKLENALIGTGFPRKDSPHLSSCLAAFNSILPDCADIRRTGSAALDLAYVAMGRFDGFWEFGLHEWDIAAGSLLVKEAGGMASDFAGGSNYLQDGNIIAGNPKIFRALQQKIELIVGSL